MDVNDDAFFLNVRVALKFFASRLNWSTNFGHQLRFSCRQFFHSYR